jgi:hypothetical protein
MALLDEDSGQYWNLNPTAATSEGPAGRARSFERDEGW